MSYIDYIGYLENNDNIDALKIVIDNINSSDKNSITLNRFNKITNLLIEKNEIKVVSKLKEKVIGDKYE